MAKSLGTNVDDLIGKSVYDLLPKDIADKRADIARKVLKTDKKVVIQDEREGRYFNNIFIPAVDEHGRKIIQVIARDITNSKKTEKKLEKLSDHFKNLFNCIADPVIIVDSKGKILEMNKMMAESLGYKREDFIGKNVFKTDLATKKTKVILIKNLVKRLAGTKLDPYEISLKASNGELIPFEINATKIDYFGKKADLVVFRDIRKRHEMQKKIKENEEKFKTIFNSAIDSIFLHDIKDLSIIDVNNQACKNFGYTKEEMLNLSVDDLSEGENFTTKSEESKKLFNKILKGETIEKEWISKRKNGEIFYNELYAKIVEIDNKKRLLVVAKDVTDKREAEKKLKAWKNRYEAAVKSSGYILYDWNSKTNKVTYGGAIKQITGYSNKELDGDISKWIDLIHPDDQEFFNSTLKNLIETKEPADLNFRLRKKNGEYIVVNDSGNFFTDSDGKIIRMLGFVKDITDSHLLKEKYKTLFDSSQDAIMILEPPTWKFTSGNKKTLELFNVKNEEEFKNLGPWDLSPKKQPDGKPSSDMAQKMIKKAMEEGSKFFEWTHMTIDGKSFPATVLLTRLELGGKQVLQATVRDITRQKYDEEKLKKSKKDVEYILDAAADAIRIVGKDFKIINANKTFLDLIGKNKEEIVGKKCRESLNSKYCKTSDCALSYVLKNKTGFTREQIMTTYDGREIDCILNVTPYLNQNGEIIGIIEDYQDISNIRKTEAKLDESQKMFKIISSSAQDGIIMIDNKGCINYWNESAEKIFGYKKEEIIGKNLHQTLAPEEFYNDYKKGFSKFKETGEGDAVGKTLDLKARRKDGKIIPIELSMSGVKIEGRWNAVGILRDITDRKKYEAQLKEKIEELERYKKVTVGRELRMVELKKQIKSLQEKIEEQGG